MTAKGFLAEVMGWLQGDAAAAAAAGAAGGLVRWLTLRENWRDGLVSLVVGSVCAIYLGPLAEPMLRPFVGAITSGQDASGFSSFVVGLGGIGLAGFVIEALRMFRTWRKEDRALDRRGGYYPAADPYGPPPYQPHGDPYGPGPGPGPQVAGQDWPQDQHGPRQADQDGGNGAK